MIKDKIEKALGDTGIKTELEISKGNFGDFFVAPGKLNELAKAQNLNPAEVAEKIGGELKSRLPDLVEKCEFQAGYLNIYLTESAYLGELKQILDDIDGYLKNPENEQKTVVFDYSSPNIAKPFSVGHLRSTVIGQANLNAHKALGYKTIGINHLGDWGTQFGKLIVAIKRWGNEEEIAKDPIKQLNDLYVKFHDEADNDESLNNEAREWFKKLEGGDSEARELWQKCIDWSMVEFDRVYKILGVEIDETMGESFYEDRLQAVIDELKEKNLLKASEGAQIVELENLPPALIQKADGATLYMTRDLAALKYRLETYKPEKIIYHVGNDQSLHFQQLIAVAKKLGWLERSGNPERSRGNTEIVFAGHGMIRLPEGKMSTRAGRTVLLEDILNEAESRAAKIIDEKSPELENKEEVAQQIAISAIKYADLSQNRKSDIIFSYDKMISLKGNSGPYLQYVYARLSSLAKKFREKFPEQEVVESFGPKDTGLAKLLFELPTRLEVAAQSSSPNLLCDLAYRIAEEFNCYYEENRIITDDPEESAKNIYLVTCVEKVLGKIFDLLGMKRIGKI